MSAAPEVADKTTKDGEGWWTGAAFVLLAPTLAWQGFVASVLWGWFAVPLGAREIGAAHAAGLFVLWSVVRGMRAEPSKATSRRLLFCALAFPLVSLFLGWLAHVWMVRS